MGTGYTVLGSGERAIPGAMIPVGTQVSRSGGAEVAAGKPPTGSVGLRQEPKSLVG